MLLHRVGLVKWRQNFFASAHLLAPDARHCVGLGDHALARGLARGPDIIRQYDFSGIHRKYSVETPRLKAGEKAETPPFRACLLPAPAGSATIKLALP